MKFFIMISLFVPSSLLACDLTAEYIEERNLYSESMSKEYRECSASITKVEYWYKYSQCRKTRDGNAGVGCPHIVARNSDNFDSLNINAEFCEDLKPSNESNLLLFEKQVLNKGIKKCKT